MNHALTPVSFFVLIAASFTGVMLPMSPSAADSTDQRARIVESSLKDLSVSNDAAIARQRLETDRETDALGDSRVVLRPEQPIDSDRAVRMEVESSLHRLRRETVSRQTADGRKARIDESLERAKDR